MPNSLELLTTVSQSVLNPCMRLLGVHVGKAKISRNDGGFVCAEVPIEHEATNAAGVLSVCVVPHGFADGGPQWAVLVCRIAVEGGRYLDQACVFMGGDRLRDEFGELLASFLNSPATDGPPPPLRRSTVVLD